MRKLTFVAILIYMFYFLIALTFQSTIPAKAQEYFPIDEGYQATIDCYKNAYRDLDDPLRDDEKFFLVVRKRCSSYYDSFTDTRYWDSFNYILYW